jgi:hypothetical protein
MIRRILRGSWAFGLKTGSYHSSTVLPSHLQGHSVGRKVESVHCVFNFGNHRLAAQSKSPGAVRLRPPLTEANCPLAMLRSPPVTDARPPLAVFWFPPQTDAKSPLIVLWKPTTRPPKLKKECSSPPPHCESRCGHRCTWLNRRDSWDYLVVTHCSPRSSFPAQSWCPWSPGH